MENNIEEMEDSEIERLLAEADLKIAENPKSLVDEDIFPDDSLIKLISMVHYLETSGIVVDAESVYSAMYKPMVTELVRRLGDLPYI